MRPDLRLRLREITKSLFTTKMGVTGVTGVTSQGGNTLSHLGVTPVEREKHQRKQCVTPVTPRHTVEKAGEDMRHTSSGVTNGVTAGLAVDGIDPEDWQAYYQERAGIREGTGPAAAYLEKAHRLAPGEARIESNLNLARQGLRSQLGAGALDPGAPAASRFLGTDDDNCIIRLAQHSKIKRAIAKCMNVELMLVL